jgi:excisionase family DNA binding protein
MNDNNNWMTIEQAAVSLGLSVRTVNRHITAGKLPSRLNEGRREVRIEIPELTSDATGAAAQVAAAGPAATDLAAPDYETVLALADNAADKADLAVSAYQNLARSADERIHATRRAANVAWCLVGVLTVAAIVSVGWTSHEITRASVEAQHLQQQVNSMGAAATAAGDECNDLRRALAEAREDAARADGQLSAYAEQRDAQLATPAPTTSPSIVDRIASIFVDE